MNNTDTKKLITQANELDVVLRAKANHEKFTQEETDWMRYAGATLGRLAQLLGQLESENANLKNMLKNNLTVR